MKKYHLIVFVCTFFFALFSNAEEGNKIIDQESDIFINELITKNNAKNISEIKTITPSLCINKEPENTIFANYECRKIKIKKIQLGIEDLSGKMVGSVFIEPDIYDEVAKKISKILKNSGRKNKNFIEWSYPSQDKYILRLSKNGSAKIQFLYYPSSYPG